MKEGYIVFYVIQIKICSEYRDVLPRPRLVCQEPRLRSIGRSPGVPDKSSRGLGSMSRFFCTDLHLFYSIHFLFLIPLCIVIRMRLVIRQSKLPAYLAEVQLAHENILCHICHMTGEIDRHNGWKLYQWDVFLAQEQSECRVFSYLWVIYLYFSLESRLIPAVLELCPVRLLWKLIRSIIWQL